MILQRIFSEITTGERLYSVTLTPEEYELWQKEFTSVRKAKKLAKKAAAAEAKFQEAVKNNEGLQDLQKASEEYNKEIGRLKNQKGAGKVLQTTEAGVTVKAIKNDKAASKIAGALGNGNAQVKENLTQQLSKSRGGQGIDMAKHIASGKYNQEGVKQGVVDTANSRKVDRSRVNSANKRAADAEQRARVAQQEAEAAKRKAENFVQRETEKAKNTGIKTQGGYVHKNNYMNVKPLVTTPPKPVVPPTSAVTKEAGKGLMGKAMDVLRKNKKTAALVGTGAALGVGAGVYSSLKKKE